MNENLDFFIVSFNFFLKFNEYFDHRGNRFQIFVKLPNAFDLRLLAAINKIAHLGELIISVNILSPVL